MARFKGVDAISQQTHRSFRSVLMISGGVLAILLGGSDVSQLAIGGVDIEVLTFKIGVLFAIVGAFLNHIINWSTDFLAYSKWELGFMRGERHLTYDRVEDSLFYLDKMVKDHKRAEGQNFEVLILYRRT
ncbi:hypothetical protein [Phaeobacter sp. J2-8]|uniref:hypothetical protein n=1 Tax=Phaeobacter sp. J2-8 TaxID=2931394 RepID=UPI001FD1F651|nr:hypothetical protein [Phaeobacter sp. J2-8]MCJ7871682.1 hypothetical protein [Phaeobacter sp. J2-8]